MDHPSMSKVKIGEKVPGVGEGNYMGYTPVSKSGGDIGLFLYPHIRLAVK